MPAADTNGSINGSANGRYFAEQGVTRASPRTGSLKSTES